MKITTPLIALVLCLAPFAVAEPIVPAGNVTEKVAEGFKFTEGPAWDGERYVYFTDIPSAHIVRFDIETGQAKTFLENSGNANGLMFNSDGRLLMCQHSARQVGRLNPDGSITTLAGSYQGKKLNSPNDLDIDQDGGIYFTDPRYGNRDSMEMDVEGVYYIKPGGDLIRVIDDLVRPNGILLSLDGKTLYVIDNGAGKVYAYDVQPGGTVKNQRLLVALNDQNKGDGDGAAMDQQGNLYITSPRTSSVWVVSPDGKILEKIPSLLPPANCTFGGPDNKTLFITARTALLTIQLKIPGR